jgi:crossover junction endodeoxyribonuclease RuvC
MIVIGIDPGLSGAVAFYDPDHDTIDVFDTPTIGNKKQRVINAPLFSSQIEERVKDHMPWVTAYLEDVHAMIGWGIGSAFRFGESKGVVQGIIGALAIKLVRVSPQKWKKALGLSRDKDSSRKLAVEIFPKHAGLFARVKDDNRAEAALIAKYGCTEMHK